MKLRCSISPTRSRLAQREGKLDPKLTPEFVARLFCVFVMGLLHMDTLLPNLIGDKSWRDFVYERIAALIGTEAEFYALMLRFFRLHLFSFVRLVSYSSESFAQLSIPGRAMSFRTLDLDSPGEELERSRGWQVVGMHEAPAR